MVTDYQRIKNAIEYALNTLESAPNFIIYPYGEYGAIAKQILNGSFGITEKYIIDNRLSKYNPNIKNLDYCRSLNREEYTVLFTCANPDVYEKARNSLEDYFPDNRIINIFNNCGSGGVVETCTQCGKYSFGPLCNHWLVESVGAFCSFALGSDVVENHAIQYVSTHPFLYYGGDMDSIHSRYEEGEGQTWHFPGVRPKGSNYRLKRIHIGNDVWLGRNVLITNSANIGNGVIAGAGAVITKDVPDYAVVAGVPARILRYRYSKGQIEALNKIAWWDWPDEKIRGHYDDFYLDIEDFIHKFLK